MAPQLCLCSGMFAVSIQSISLFFHASEIVEFVLESLELFISVYKYCQRFCHWWFWYSISTFGMIIKLNIGIHFNHRFSWLWSSERVRSCIRFTALSILWVVWLQGLLYASKWTVLGPGSHAQKLHSMVTNCWTRLALTVFRFHYYSQRELSLLLRLIVLIEIAYTA